MNNINKEKERWNKQKSMGKKKFVLIYGVLLWGICSSIVYGTLTIFFNPNPTNYTIAGVIFRFICYAIIFGLCGILFGIVLWNTKIKKFNNE